MSQEAIASYISNVGLHLSGEIENTLLAVTGECLQCGVTRNEIRQVLVELPLTQLREVHDGLVRRVQNRHTRDIYKNWGDLTLRDVGVVQRDTPVIDSTIGWDWTIKAGTIFSGIHYTPSFHFDQFGHDRSSMALLFIDFLRFRSYLLKEAPSRSPSAFGHSTNVRFALFEREYLDAHITGLSDVCDDLAPSLTHFSIGELKKLLKYPLVTCNLLLLREDICSQACEDKLTKAIEHHSYYLSRQIVGDGSMSLDDVEKTLRIQAVLLATDVRCFHR
jgi:hypothetical protein